MEMLKKTTSKKFLNEQKPAHNPYHTGQTNSIYLLAVSFLRLVHFDGILNRNAK